jgi:hypothetical protein
MFSQLVKKPTPELKLFEKNVLPDLLKDQSLYVEKEHLKFVEETKEKPILPVKIKKNVSEKEEEPIIRKKVNQSAAPEFVMPKKNHIDARMASPETVKEIKHHNFTAPPERRLGRPVKSIT